MRRPLLLACVLTGCVAPAQAPDTTLPEDFELVVSEDFDDPASLSRWKLSDPRAWSWSPDGSLQLTGASEYAPPYRSPHSIALLESPAVGDFVLEADLLQTGREYGHRDLCLILGFVNAAQYTYVHLATTPDANAHNIFLVDDAARRPLAPVAEGGVDWGTDTWHHVRLERLAGQIRVFFDDRETPVLSAPDSTGTGRVGLGSFDDEGRFDNLRIWAREAAPWATDTAPFARP